MKSFLFLSQIIIVLLLFHIKVLQGANKLEVELDLQSGRVIPSVHAAKSQVSFIVQPTAASQPDRCDGQAVVRLDFNGPFKKAKIELIYGEEPRLWTATISNVPTSYGFGSNFNYSSNCATAEIFNHQFRVYSNKLPGFRFDSQNGNSLMVTEDEVVENGANMTIDIANEAITWETHYVNSSSYFHIKNNRYLFSLSGQKPTFGPPSDGYIYAGFNRVPYGNFHNGSGLCRVRITFKRDLGKDSPCATGNHDCHKFAECHPVKRSLFKCICKPGYLGDGRKCKEFDPCSANNGGCQHLCRRNSNGHASCSCNEGFHLHPNKRDCLATEEVRKRIRIKMAEALPCKSKDIKDHIVSKFHTKLLSLDACNFPCKIYKPFLRCRPKDGDRLVVSVYFDIELHQNVISPSKFCNITCARCQMEDRLQKLIAELRGLTNGYKLNVTLYDKTFTFARNTLRISKEREEKEKEEKGKEEGDQCYKTARKKFKRQARCQPGKYYDIYLRKCMNCSRGSYQPNRSENFCFRCPDNKTTLYAGASDISQCIDTICGGNLTSMSGVITSPNHPDPYPKGIECVWNIRCPEGRGLLLLIPNISLPLTMDCSDHLIMRKNASPFSKTTYYACESYDNPVAFISRSKDLYVKFTSKSTNEMAEGFKIFYVTFQEKYRSLVKSIVQDGKLYGNSSLRKILQDESLITQILDIMVHPHKFFYLPKNAKNKLPEFYSFVEKKVEAKLNLKPYK
nr:signal peptide, CUB and EGF-like domain-containing protein 2 [Pocillopora verrucosa]